MGGFFGVTSKRDCVADVFFGVDYHSHLGTRRGGMAAFDTERGFQREIHNIENSPFRTKFDATLDEMKGNACIGCISDMDPQPFLIRSHHGVFAITTVGVINNAEQLIARFFEKGGNHFESMSGGKVNDSELIASMICAGETVADGIRFAQEQIDGSATILLLMSDGSLIAARDKLGRLPVVIAKDEDGYCVTFESFAAEKLGYEIVRDLGPGEVVRLTPDCIEVLAKPGDKMRICAFLWTYYGYPNSTYEGVNVEVSRNRNGAILAEADRKAGLGQDVDSVCGVPDSGVPHAVGYANATSKPFARPFIKYTPTWPRSFMPQSQAQRNRIAKMKMIPVNDLIEGKKLLFVDDSIVRGTQLRETVEFLYDHGAKEVHMRSACPPIMFGCKYLNFSRSTSDMDLLARRTIRELEGEEGDKYIAEYSDGSTERGKKMRCEICKKLHLSSVEYQSVNGVLESIGIDPEKVCTYCWTGKE